MMVLEEAALISQMFCHLSLVQSEKRPSSKYLHLSLCKLTDYNFKCVFNVFITSICKLSVTYRDLHGWCPVDVLKAGNAGVQSGLDACEEAQVEGAGDLDGFQSERGRVEGESDRINHLRVHQQMWTVTAVS